MTTDTISGTHGSAKTPCDVFTYECGAVTWYCVAGSVNVNATRETLLDGVDVETVQDVDTCTASNPIESESELEACIDEYADEQEEQEETTVETILESWINGQKKQACEQIDDIDLSEFVDRWKDESDDFKTGFEILHYYHCVYNV